MRAATGALIGAILVAAVVFAITPARHWTQQLGACREATSVQRDLGRNTSVISADGRTGEDFAMICRYPTGVKGVSTARAVLGGLGVSLGIGVLAGALLGGLLGRRFQRSGP